MEIVTNSNMILVIIIGLITLGVLVFITKFSRQIATVLLTLVGLVVVGIGALALITQGVANKESAEAAQTAAVAATTASVGQTLSSVGMALFFGGAMIIVVLIAVIAIGGYFWLRAKRAETMGRSSNWKSGPNALWGRDAQPQISSTEMMLPMLMQQMAMMQAMMMSTFQHGTPPAVPQQPPPTPLLPPGQYVVDDGEVTVPADWDWGDWQV